MGELLNLPPARNRYVAGLATDGDGTMHYSVHVVTEHYDPETGEARGRLALQTVIPDMSEEQARHLQLQLANALGITAEYEAAIANFAAQIVEAQDALRAARDLLAGNREE